MTLISDHVEADMRGRIVVVAEKLFREIGYQKTTVADIAKVLRMSPANVYRFFDSKKSIISAVAQRLMGEVEEAAGVIVANPDVAHSSSATRSCDLPCSRRTRDSSAPIDSSAGPAPGGPRESATDDLLEPATPVSAEPAGRPPVGNIAAGCGSARWLAQPPLYRTTTTISGR